jgi:hypothetical protein
VATNVAWHFGEIFGRELIAAASQLQAAGA